MKHNVKATAPAPDEPLEALLARVQSAGAESADALGWHYIQVLARRACSQSGPVQALLQHKLRQALFVMEASLTRASGQKHQDNAKASVPASLPSPLSTLLQDMRPVPATDRHTLRPAGPLAESAGARQLRQQLRRIGVQKQVSRAMASGPQNAGPINSHLLVLRALGLMRDISPDYLSRFMVHLDTLMCLQDHPLQVIRSVAPPGRQRKRVQS